MIEIKISEMLGRRKMTQKALAEATGIRPNTISAMWHGRIKRLEIDQLDRICESLGCQPGELLEYKGERDTHVNKTQTSS
ncbi:MAG: helix-turn-helix transcriptional regulator [Desulfitobacteriaceae bacterium]